MTRRDPASRDYSRARAALPIEQREVWLQKGDNIGVAGEVQPDGSQRVILNERGRELFGRAEIVLVPPTRDGTCADDSDECEGCRCAPPLVQGGQGRSDAATMSAGELASWIFVLGVSAAALFLVARWWGLV